MKAIVFSIVCFFCLYLSCSKDDENTNECISTGVGYVTSVSSPSEGTINEKVDIELEFPVYNGCGGFGRFLETQDGNSRTVEVQAKYEGCLCTTDIPIITANYEFTTDRPGRYELNFKSSETELITVNLSIN